MTKIYENDEKDKLLPISITTNFSLRTSRALFLFVIKRYLHLVFLSVGNAQSFADHLSKSHNLKASPFRTIGALKGTIIEKWTWLTAAEKNE
jgi:hypothetical protein